MKRLGRPPHPDVLTPREWEVRDLLREGVSNEEIARRLGISLAGAKYHVSEILGKLAVSSREEAARWQPERRPRWATAVAPLAFLWRRVNASALSTAVAGGLAIVVVAGVGLLVWGLLRTGAVGKTPRWPQVPLARRPPSSQNQAALLLLKHRMRQRLSQPFRSASPSLRARPSPPTAPASTSSTLARASQRAG